MANRFEERAGGVRGASRGEGARADLPASEPASEVDRGVDSVQVWGRDDRQTSEGRGRPIDPQPGRARGWGRGEIGRDDLRGYHELPPPALARQPRWPKGYRRSDARIEEEVCERLGDREDLDLHDVSVKVDAGEVLLEGTTRDREDKLRIEEIAASVLGVEDVANRLRVRRPSL